MSLFWSLEFWEGLSIFGKFMCPCFKALAESTDVNMKNGTPLRVVGFMVEFCKRKIPRNKTKKETQKYTNRPHACHSKYW
jgi:hypothetical protein